MATQRIAARVECRIELTEERQGSKSAVVCRCFVAGVVVVLGAVEAEQDSAAASVACPSRLAVLRSVELASKNRLRRGCT